MSGRKFLSDGGFLFGAEGLARVFAFSVTFILAHRVGLESLALLGLAQSLVAYATVAGDGGLGTAAVRRIAMGDSTVSVVRDTARAQVFLSTVASALLFPIVAIQTSVALALVLGTLPIITAASTSYVLQGRMDAKWIAFSRVAGNIVVGCTGIVLSVFSFPIWAIALAYPLGSLVSMSIVNSRSKVAYRVIFGRVSLRHLRDEARPYLSLAFYTVILHGYSSSLIILARSLNGGSYFVEVALATRLLLLMVIPAQILGSLLLPRYSARVASQSLQISVWRDAFVALGAGLLIFATVASTANWVVPLLFGAGASSSVPGVQIIAAQVPLAMVSTVLTALLLANKNFGILSVTYCCALVAQILCGLGFARLSAGAFVFSIVVSEAVFVALLLIATLWLRSRSKSHVQRSGCGIAPVDDVNGQSELPTGGQ